MAPEGSMPPDGRQNLIQFSTLPLAPESNINVGIMATAIEIAKTAIGLPNLDERKSVKQDMAMNVMTLSKSISPMQPI